MSFAQRSSSASIFSPRNPDNKSKYKKQHKLVAPNSHQYQQGQKCMKPLSSCSQPLPPKGKNKNRVLPSKNSLSQQSGSLYTQSELMGSDSPKKNMEGAEEDESKDLGFSNELILIEAIKRKVSDHSKRLLYFSLVEKCLSSPAKDRALGCLFGSFIGDALGAYCQFSKSISPEMIDKVMTMPGGGVFSLKAGQFTDDSQLSAHLLHALNQLSPSTSLQSQQYTLIKLIAQQYVRWLESNPFDLGITCRKSIIKLQRQLPNYRDLPEGELRQAFEKIYPQILKENKESESNGSLMRITPMAVLMACSGLQPHQHQQFIKNEVRLVHPKSNIQTASLLWVDTLARLINRTDNSSQTFRTIYQRTEEMDPQKSLEEWFDESKKEERMNATVNIGWSKIAWSYGMSQLHKLGSPHHDQPSIGSSPASSQPRLDQHYYKAVMRDVIVQAGDTDTNAAIVGGLLGAVVGFSHLPALYITKMMELQFEDDLEQVSEDSGKRSHFYEPFNVLLEAVLFIDKCGEYEHIHREGS